MVIEDVDGILFVQLMRAMLRAYELAHIHQYRLSAFSPKCAFPQNIK
jgi:hypothetical protein